VVLARAAIPGERQLDSFLVGHLSGSQVSSTVLPRLAAISDGTLQFCAH
jgi:hypothetical protein